MVLPASNTFTPSHLNVKRIVQQLKYIIKYLLSLINNPEQTWQYLKDGDVPEAKPEYMQTNYYFPMLGAIGLFLFVKSGWGEPFDIESAMKSSVSFITAYFVAPYLAIFILEKLYGKIRNFTFDKAKLTLFVGYCLSFLMLVRIFSASFPHIKFLIFCSLYLPYIIWCGAEVFIGIAEKERWKFTILAFGAMWFSPFLVEKLMSIMMR